MKLGIIGGSSIWKTEFMHGWEPLPHPVAPVVNSYGYLDTQVWRKTYNSVETFYVNRHGRNHESLAHEVNYRGILWRMHMLGVDAVLALNTVGGVSNALDPGDIVAPTNLIDYTFGRESTFGGQYSKHIDFTYPFNVEIVRRLKNIKPVRPFDDMVYGCTNGPRFETAAEVRRMHRDGVGVVGMTGMPEAYLARELGIEYNMLSLVVNAAAGLVPGTVDPEAFEQKSITEYFPRFVEVVNEAIENVWIR